MIVLIDGFNLIYKFPDLEELMYQGKLEEARIGLLNKLKEYEKITRTRIRVVFDGKKQPSLAIKSERVGSIDVYYSLEFSADFLIKEFIKKDLNPKMTKVITSDKDIIAYVTRFKARQQSSEEFAKVMLETIQKWHEPKITEKEDNPVVTDQEISFWEKLFKR